MENFKPMEGTIDLFPDDHKYYTFLKKVFRHEFRRNGFRRISTPILESNDIIEKVFGEKKSKYVCSNEKGTIRPNAHIGIMRAYLNGAFNEGIQPVYFYYMDRQFNTRNGNYEEFHQIGGEILGEDDPILDAIIIYMNYVVLNNIGLKDTYEISINSMGLEKERQKYREELLSFYDNKKHILSDESQKKLDIDPIMLLNSSLEDDIILAQSAPKMTKFLKKHSKEHYEKFKQYLDILSIPYKEDHTVISDYGYAVNSVWEIRDKDDKTLICSGFRYDDLSKRLELKNSVPATGFSVNVKILIDKLKQRQIKIRNKDDIDLYFVQLGDEAKKVILPLSLKSREEGINTVVSLGTPSIKEQMLKAQRSGSKYIVIVGIMEARNGIFQVRNNIAGTQEAVKKDDLINYIIDKIGKDKLDFYSPARDLLDK